MVGLVVSEVDPHDPEVLALLERHWEFTTDVTPPEHIHALDLDGLTDEAVTMFGLRDESGLLGIGALKTIDEHHVEIKSMHTAESARGLGVGRAVLAHLLATARQRGASRISLETGKQTAFQPAISLYEDAGFVRCGPFEGYEANSNSVFMTLELA